jgi:tetrahydrodipicolinate N-succinyltransferase
MSTQAVTCTIALNDGSIVNMAVTATDGTAIELKTSGTVRGRRWNCGDFDRNLCKWKNNYPFHNSCKCNLCSMGILVTTWRDIENTPNRF